MAQYKVQRLYTSTFVITDTYGEAADMARQDAKMNNTLLVISEYIRGKWYRVEAMSRDYEIIPRSRGYEIRKKNGKWWLYLESIYNGEYKWVTDHTYSRVYKSFKTALEVFKALNEGRKA